MKKPTDLKPITLLLLEDEPFIALDVEEVLNGAGLSDIHTVSTCRDAESWLLEATPHVAVIDPRLNDGICVAAVRHLVARGVPFVVYSGESGSLIDEEPAFGRGLWLTKPCGPDELISAVGRAVSMPQSTGALAPTPSRGV